MIADGHRPAAIGELRRAGIVAEGEDRGFRADAHIRANPDGITAAVEQAAVVDHAALAEVHAGAVQKAAMHLHATAGPEAPQPPAQGPRSNQAGGQVAEPIVVQPATPGARQQTGTAHGLIGSGSGSSPSTWATILALRSQLLARS